MKNMKKNTKLLFFIPLALIALTVTTSCGGREQEKEEIIAPAKVKPEKVQISGDLSDYLQIVDNEYEIIDDYGAHLSIKVKAIKKMSAEELDVNNFELSASILGSSGMPVSGTGIFEIEDSSEDKLLSLLKNGSGEEVIELQNYGDYEAEKHASKSKKFTVTSSMKEKPVQTESTGSYESSESAYNSPDAAEPVSSIGNEDFDQMLDDYDEFVTEYIKFYKKAQKGDNTALAEYPALMEKATSLSERMTKAKNQNQLNAAQVSRMVKIQTKMLQAASAR
jgi:hypothetical protein